MSVLTKYLNTVGNLSGGTGDDDTTSGSTRAFASYVDFEAWLYTTYPNMGTSTVQVDLICKGTIETLSAPLNLRSTMTSTYFVRFIGAPGHQHGGRYDSAKAGISCTDLPSTIAGVGAPYARYRRFQVVNEKDTGYGSCIQLPDNTNCELWFEDVVLHIVYPFAGHANAVYSEGAATSKKFYASNLVVSGKSDLGLWLNHMNTVVIHKAVVTGAATFGVTVANTDVVSLKEIVSDNPGTDFFVVSNTSQTVERCVSSDASSPTVAMRNLSPVYYNAGAFDFRPDTTDIVMKGQGADMSADATLAVANDIVGVAFVSPFDLGPFKVAAGGGPTPPDYISDAFTDTDGTSLADHDMVSGNGWVLTQSTGQATALWDIQGNKARSAGGGLALAVADSNKSDMWSTVSISVPASGSWAAGLVFRFVDGDNHWNARLQVDTDGTHVYLLRVHSGTITLEDSAVLGTLSGTVVFGVRCYGTSIGIFVGNTIVLAFTSTFNQSAKTHGLMGVRGTIGPDTFGPVLYDNYKTDQLSLLVCDGDSLTEGLTSPTNYPWQIQNFLGPEWVVNNQGTGGETSTEILSVAAGTIDTLYSASVFQKNAVAIMAGTNDLRQNFSAASAIASLTTYATGRQAVGFKVVSVTMTPCGSWPGGSIDEPQAANFEARRQLVNTGVRALLGVHTDAIADVGGPGTLLGDSGDETNDTYYQADHTHFKLPGYIEQARIIAAALLGIYSGAEDGGGPLIWVRLFGAPNIRPRVSHVKPS